MKQKLAGKPSKNQSGEDHGYSDTPIHSPNTDRISSSGGVTPPPLNFFLPFLLKLRGQMGIALKSLPNSDCMYPALFPNLIKLDINAKRIILEVVQV